jgi:DNA-binding transcriptional LysR family regulator
MRHHSLGDHSRVSSKVNKYHYNEFIIVYFGIFEGILDIAYGMKVLLQVVDSGSFARAAETLDLSNAAVTRQVSALEAHIGARLLNRTTRRLSLTEAGVEYCIRARAILEQIAEAESNAAAGTARPTGTLKVSAPLSFGVLRLADVLPQFRTRYPQLKLDIDLSDRVVDLANEGFDVALRIATALESRLIARRIAPIAMVLCAAPEYLQRHGTPREPTELSSHEVLSYRYLWSGDDWTFTDEAGRKITVRVRPEVHATNGDLLRRLAVAGGGIILQPAFIVEDDLRHGRLIRLLENLQAPAFNLYAVYLSHQHLPARVRAFIDFLLEHFGPRSSGNSSDSGEPPGQLRPATTVAPRARRPLTTPRR